MEGVTLTVADLAMVFGPMFAVVIALMRYQHVDGTKTRELMHKLITDSTRETRELVEKTNQETRELVKENRELIEKNHQELSGSISELSGRLSSLGERVARIEGFLKLWPSPPPSPEDGDAQAA
ncbi:hypothetical protein [Candidatus Poriferisocius sp.]|uniref:hypothetical protein n=1 Tax=Candidatus Poriferisocius sp. TaxID=3101276 RepID=UPI003B02D51C